MAVFDGSTRFACDIGDNGSQFDIGVFQGLLDAVDQAGAVSGQTAAVAGQISQFPLGTRRHKAGSQ